LCGAEAVIAAALITAAALTAAPAPGAKLLAESALAAAATLTAALAVGVAVVVRRGTQARCACFGIGAGGPIGRAHLVRNLTLLAVICAGLAAVMLTHGRPAVAAVAVAVAAGVLAAAVFIRWEDLTELFAPIPQPLAGAPGVRRSGRGPH
jgi:hypothetical protein